MAGRCHHPRAQPRTQSRARRYTGRQSTSYTVGQIATLLSIRALDPPQHSKSVGNRYFWSTLGSGAPGAALIFIQFFEVVVSYGKVMKRNYPTPSRFFGPLLPPSEASPPASCTTFLAIVSTPCNGRSPTEFIQNLFQQV
ncbi:hypothetical protein K443DRAFT_676332 [Laccaria amethystina LaAM-08-1]|jgi:hypothetical protein|uniref:Uncharacterized protein n=1 Tax=Laccaria amethystina LaAM-08-1 TaxID=1095629 RepID=A0A0C9XQV9_9AGAR|nr:hypothetical protein K443DRAFT_676332 [Laccaria amethystina LaAM-08-1]